MQDTTYALVWACAWCPKDTWPVLKTGEIYTHGICPEHLLILKKATLKKYQEKPLTSPL